MEPFSRPTPTTPHSGNRKLRFDLGRFVGFNFRTQTAVERLLTAPEVVDWDHARDGETEFRPLGDRRELVLAIGEGNPITATGLLALDRLLEAAGGDTVEVFLRLRHALNQSGRDLTTVTVDDLTDPDLHVFFGSPLTELRAAAVAHLVERYRPEVYRGWKSSVSACLSQDPEAYLRREMSSVETLTLASRFALLVVR